MEEVIAERFLQQLRTIGDPLLDDRGGAGGADVRAELAYIQEVRERGIVDLADRVEAHAPAAPSATKQREEYIKELRRAVRGRLALDGTGPPRAGGPPPIALFRPPDAGEARRRARLAADAEAFREAQELFGRYSTEISAALLLAALPQTYATRWGPSVLVATGGLVTGLRRRIRGTAQFLMRVMTAPKGPARSPREPWADAVSAAVELRVLHHSIRTGLSPQARRKARKLGLVAPGPGEGHDVPLNQEDLLGTLLTFTVTVFEVLEQFGITWTRDEQEAYLRAWDKVGAFLGIGDADVMAKLQQKTGAEDKEILPPGWTTLRPPTVAAARAMMAAFRERHWIPIEPWTGRNGPGASSPLSAEWESLRPGRLLTSALLDELAAAMTPRTRALPSILMRTLAPPVVRDRLALGAGGMLQALADGMPRRHVRQDGFTVVTPTATFAAPALRQTANYVVRKTFLHFLQDGEHFSLPGFTPEWQSDLLAAR